MHHSYPILFLALLLLTAGCKKAPIEELIIGKWTQPDDSKRDITFNSDSSVAKTFPASYVSGNWYKNTTGELLFDVTHRKLDADKFGTFWRYCTVTYKIVECKKNKLMVQDINTEGTCTGWSDQLHELGNKTWEYERVK